MKNNQLLPFERNRYYAGKMLTSIDFQAEQIYMNNKRRFLNQTLYGPGIVCGLDVTNLDDLSILVENGVAIDNKGREIVVPTSVVKKLSAIEGFEKLSTDKVTLKIRYREENVHPVYSVAGSDVGEEYEFNRIHEDYEIYIEDSDNEFAKDSQKLFLKEEYFLENENYKVSILIPTVVTKGKLVKIIVKIKKTSDKELPLSFKGILQLPVFRTEENEKELKIQGTDISLNEGAVLEQPYWIYTESTEIQESTILLKKDGAEASIGNQEVEIKKGLMLKVALTEIKPNETALREIGKINYEKRIERDANKEIKLAEFSLLRTEGAYVIDTISDAKNYISTPYGADQRREYRSYFEEERKTQKIQSHETSPLAASLEDFKSTYVSMASGTIEIPLNVDMKKGEICVSEEIMHGLGKGNVYIDAGVQFIETDSNTLKDCRTTIYGEAGLFQETDYMWVQTAVKVFHDKGSFQIAAKLVGEQKSIVLLFNWIAIKFLTAEESHIEEDQSDWSILPDTPTISMHTRDSFSFHVRFENMKPSRLTYELTESGSGEITSDGIYTAPSKEGVYEIHIFCTDFPKISTYAYAIVKKAP